MPIAPETAQSVLTSLFNFQIEAFDLANLVAPQRTPESLAGENAQEEAIRATLRQAFALRDRSAACEPLAQVAIRLNVAFDQEGDDHRILAMKAVRVLIDASDERQHRMNGYFLHPKLGNLQEVARESVHIYSADYQPGGQNQTPN